MQDLVSVEEMRGYGQPTADNAPDQAVEGFRARPRSP